MPIISSSTGYDPKYGFTEPHWRIIQWYATRHDMVLLFRSGKPAAIPYIEKRFPAKPMPFKAKVDKDKGLLIALTQIERNDVAKLGRWLLRPSGNADGLFVAYSPIAPDVERARFDRKKHPWADTDVVIESAREPYLPFTSDYDLAGIIPQSGQFKVLPTTLPMAAPSSSSSTSALKSTNKTGKALFSPENVKEVLDQNMDRKHGWENTWTRRVREELNERFKDERIQHGPQSLYIDPRRAGAMSEVEFANGDNETILAFRPDRKVQVHKAEKAAESARILDHYR